MATAVDYLLLLAVFTGGLVVVLSVLNKLARRWAKGTVLYREDQLIDKSDVELANMMYSNVGEAVEELTFYTASCVMWAIFYYDQDWTSLSTLRQSMGDAMIADYTRNVPLAIIFTYFFEFAWYTQGIIKLVTNPIKKKDFGTMLGHHIITMGLILFSFCTLHYTPGLLVIMVHNIGDPFLQLGKLCSYKKLMVADPVFVVFIIAFHYPRLYFLPLAIREFYLSSVDKGIETWSTNGQVCLLCALIPFHLYWSYFILRMAIKVLISGQTLQDSREEDQGKKDKDA